MIDWGAAINATLSALQTLSGLGISAIRWGFLYVLGWHVDDWMIEIAVIIGLGLSILKWGKVLGRIILIILLILLANTLVQLVLPPLF